MSAASGVFYQHPLPGVYICYARPGGQGPRATGNTIEEALENLQSLWRDMGMVPWEPGRNLIDGPTAVVAEGSCYVPSMAAADADIALKRLMENSR